MSLMRTYCEFTFDAAHSVPPYAGLHGHTFVAKLTFGGSVDPVFGWPVNLYDVEAFIEELKSPRGGGLDHANLDEIAGIGPASLENITKYIWKVFSAKFPNIEEIELRRGFPGTTEGCIYQGETADKAKSA